MKSFLLSGADGASFNVTIWDEVTNPKAVLQFAHGMTEYSARYADVAPFFNKAGYIFVGSDHRGHGFTAGKENLGITKGDAYGKTIEDMSILTRYAKETYNLPVVLFGHSYGSFLTQGYLQKYGGFIDAVILSGSTYMGTPIIKLGAIIAKIQKCFLMGKRPDNFMVKQTFASYAKSFPIEEGPFSWLTRDKIERDLFQNDEMTGYIMCVNFYASFLKGISRTYKTENMAKIPKNLPMFIISGRCDPIAKGGLEIERLYNNYIKAGLSNVKMKLYDEARHKILAEINKEEAITDIINFFDSCICPKKSLIKIPYDTGEILLELLNKPKAILSAKMHDLVPDKSAEEIITEALDHPIGSPSLSNLAKGKNKITIITSDHTRAVPSKITLPIILAKLREGNSNADITIIVATGLHRLTTEQEQRQMFGDNIVDNEKIIVNDANDLSQFVDLGALPSGASCNINKAAIDCDLLISEGFIEPHFFAGFSGGRKSVMPGISSRESINENHCFRALANPCSTSGILQDNPVHLDMLAAAEKAKLAFILNVTLNGKKQVLGAFAGEMHMAHEKGVEHVKACSHCDIVKGDIVITSNGGYPLDQNLYQTPKAISTAALCAKDNGVIIMCAACVDGIGGDNFAKVMQGGTPEELENILSKIPPKETIPEMWNAQVLLRVLKKHKVILVSNLSPDIIIQMNMIPTSNIDQALAIAYDLKGKGAEVVVIPDGVTVLCQ